MRPARGRACRGLMSLKELNFKGNVCQGFYETEGSEREPGGAGPISGTPLSGSLPAGGERGVGEDLNRAPAGRAV